MIRFIHGSVFILVACILTLFLILDTTRPPPSYFYFIFDISRSASIEDHKDNVGGMSRLNAAKHAAEEVIKMLPKESMIRIGVFVGNDQEHKTLRAVFPWREKETHTHDIDTALHAISWRHAWTAGSNIMSLLQNLKYEEVPKRGMNTIIFTDGGDEESLTKLAPTLPDGIRVIFVGLGDFKKSFVPAYDEWGRKTHDYLKKNDGEYFSSNINERFLKNTAKQLRGEYIRLEHARATKTILSLIIDNQSEINAFSILMDRNTLLLLIIIVLLVLYLLN